ncbi:MAG: hypothetical protein ACYCZ2_14980 [Lutibacter sp.]|nr:MAG: hypothetical protein APF83_02745 [Lutibacter sp. BRH_c52]HCE55706.1 hypothetical protein [Lutibacter sp.]
MTKQQIFIAIILSVIGLGVWIVASRMSNEVEAWDSIQYYKISLPIMFIVSAIAGFIEPKRPWMWGVFVVILQPISHFVQTGGSPYVVVGLFFFFFFIGMTIGFAYVGVWLRKFRR